MAQDDLPKLTPITEYSERLADLPKLTPITEYSERLAAGSANREEIQLVIDRCADQAKSAYQQGCKRRGDAFHCQAESLAHLLMGENNHGG